MNLSHAIKMATIAYSIKKSFGNPHRFRDIGEILDNGGSYFDSVNYAESKSEGTISIKIMGVTGKFRLKAGLTGDNAFNYTFFDRLKNANRMFWRSIHKKEIVKDTLSDKPMS